MQKTSRIYKAPHSATILSTSRSFSKTSPPFAVFAATQQGGVGEEMQNETLFRSHQPLEGLVYEFGEGSKLWKARHNEAWQVLPSQTWRSSPNPQQRHAGTSALSTSQNFSHSVSATQVNSGIWPNALKNSQTLCCTTWPFFMRKGVKVSLTKSRSVLA